MDGELRGSGALELVKRAADLSWLNLTGAEAQDAAAELEKMLRCMDVLRELDPDGEEPEPDCVNVLREDEPASR